MGGGSYSMDTRTVRASSLNYHTNSIHENFKQREIHNKMDPKGIEIRESCDSEEHPNSVAIMLALDLTASMGSIPQHLVTDGLPHIMDSIIQRGVADPQLLFTGVGDHECDRAPLQIGQFESSDELLDKWLTDIYIERGGGGNDGESYLLAWYFAAQHTSIDCFKKRAKKGYLFTIGDEPTLDSIPGSKLDDIMGPAQHKNKTAVELLDEARQTYHVYHLHVKEGSNGRSQHVMDGWKQLMGENLILVDDHKDVSSIIADIITEHEKGEVDGEVVGQDAPEEML